MTKEKMTADQIRGEILVREREMRLLIPYSCPEDKKRFKKLDAEVRSLSTRYNQLVKAEKPIQF